MDKERNKYTIPIKKAFKIFALLVAELQHQLSSEIQGPSLFSFIMIYCYTRSHVVFYDMYHIPQALNNVKMLASL